MKKFFTLFTAILISFTVIHGQDAPPQAFSFKATIVSKTGALVTSKTVSIRLSIIKNNNNGISMYTETFSPKTNEYGQVDILIGNGSKVSGNFSDIDWSSDKYFLKVEVDANGGKTYILMSVTQLLSVPYAMYAKTAGSVKSGGNEKDPVFGSSPAKGISASNITNWNNAFGWGNHASAGYLKKYTETDPVWTSASANYYTKSNLQTSGASQIHFNNLTNRPTTLAGYGITDGPDNSWANLTGKPTTLSGYGITDAMSTSHVANGITSTNITNWNTAIGWGNHAGLYRLADWVPSWNDIAGKPFRIDDFPKNGDLLMFDNGIGRWINWTPDFTSGSIETDPIFTAWNKSSGISITASQVNDFQSSVTNNAAMLLNTVKNSYPSADAAKLAAITGSNTGDQDLSGLATTSAVTTSLNLKVDKDAGKGLSSNDYTTVEKAKLAGIEAGAQVNVKPDWNAASGNVAEILNKPTIPAAADGSETKVTAGTSVTVTGAGTTASPYVVNATGATTLTIGQSYQGGIIFWLDATGQHGLIAATADQSTGIQWYNGTYRYTGTSGDGLYAGAMNTTMIVVTQMADNQAENFAAKVCADFSVNIDGVPYGDWYLPSKIELNLLYMQKSVVGGFASSYYWSSTEYHNNYAWIQYFSSGDQDLDDKGYTYCVRAVRAF